VAFFTLNQPNVVGVLSIGVYSRYRQIYQPILGFVKKTERQKPGRLIAVIIPELVGLPGMSIGCTTSAVPAWKLCSSLKAKRASWWPILRVLTRRL